MPKNAQNAEVLHRLHAGPTPLLLANVWDAGSARVVEEAGATAVATSSAAMAWSAGYADGERLPVPELLAGCARIARVVTRPLTVDIEHGYGRSAQEVGRLGEALIELGAVGVNIEDGQAADGPQQLGERIAALRAVAARSGVRFFINARCDVYLGPAAEPTQRLDEVLRRARLYIEAGADGLFVPGLGQLDDIASLARAIGATPLNIYAGYAGAPTVQALAAAGVRRISLGCGTLQAAYGLLGRIARQLTDEGRYDEMGAVMRPSAELNRLFD